MKSIFALALVGIATIVAYRLSSPMFDAAAEDLCSAYAESQGWELVDWDGRLGYDRKRPLFQPRFAAYFCRFEDPSGQAIFLDQLDSVMPVTGRSRLLRAGGWVTMIAFPVGAMALSGWTGLLPGKGRDDD